MILMNYLVFIVYFIILEVSFDLFWDEKQKLDIKRKRVSVGKLKKAS